MVTAGALLLAAPAAAQLEPGPGRLMKEWLAVSSRRLDWVALAREARRFVEEGA